MTYYSSNETPLTYSHKWRGLSAATLVVLIVLGLIAMTPALIAPSGTGDIVIPGQDWHGNVRRSTPPQ